MCGLERARRMITSRRDADERRVRCIFLLHRRSSIDVSIRSPVHGLIAAEERSVKIFARLERGDALVGGARDLFETIHLSLDLKKRVVESRSESVRLGFERGDEDVEIGGGGADVVVFVGGGLVGDGEKFHLGGRRVDLGVDDVGDSGERARGQGARARGIVDFLFAGGRFRGGSVSVGAARLLAALAAVISSLRLDAHDRVSRAL